VLGFFDEDLALLEAVLLEAVLLEDALLEDALLEDALLELCFFLDETCLRECRVGGFQPTALSARNLAGIAIGPSA